MVDVAVDWSNKLQQGFSEVRGDPFMGQGCAKRLRMTGCCQRTICINAQCFALKTALDPLKSLRMFFQPGQRL